jgi:cyclopropane fatty-acyl-phospholipid synthase-like methyltransferase
MFRQIRSVLAVPAVYKMWWTLIGGAGVAKGLVNDYIRPQVGARILDIGCGPGTIVGHMSQVDYLGFDLSPEYIEMARARFPQAQFVCERVSKFSLAKHQQNFDFVLALGILHHLDDEEARQLFQIAHDALRPGGKLITFDGVWTNDQSPVARWLLSRDRGEHIRTQEAYVKIASQVFTNVKATVRHDLIRIPYSHIILECYR